MCIFGMSDDLSGDFPLKKVWHVTMVSHILEHQTDYSYVTSVSRWLSLAFDSVLEPHCRIGWAMSLLNPKSQAPAQALTLLYIGGASSTSNLLSCQEVDGAGET